MSAIAFEILVILVLLLINGLFAMSEIAVVTAKRVRLEQQAERGSAGARAALRLAQDPTSFLSTVQVGITLVGVIASAYGGATLSEALAGQLASVTWIASHTEVVSLVIVVAGITFFSVIIGELVPKRIALGNPERIAALVARPMTAIARAGKPLVAVLVFVTHFLLRLVGVRSKADPGLTEEEIHAVIEQGAESGVVPQLEHKIVESVFRLGDRQVGSIMAPRPDVEWVDVNADAAGLRAAVQSRRRAWLLVCDGEVDALLGVAHTNDLLVHCLDRKPVDLRSVLVEPQYVPATTPAFRLLETFRSTRQHVAVVLDEYGSVQGVLGLDDLIEEIIGEMPEGDAPVHSMITRTVEGSWMIDGATPIEDVQEAVDSPPMDVESRRGYRTLAGFVLGHLGRVPKVGDTIRWEGLRFSVEALDGRRIERVHVTRERPSAQSIRE